MINNYNRKKRFFTGLVAACIFMGCTTKQKKNEVKEAEVNTRPNIILVMADDLGYETLGVNGSNSYKTPNLDKLANEGMNFEHCYSTPLCTPSRVQIMTGKYNSRNYIGFGLLKPNEKTFGHYMKEAGYKTYIAGKWQLLGSDHQQKLAGNKKGTIPENAGFDDYCLWQIDTLGSRYKDPLLSKKGEKAVMYKNGFGPDVFVEHINGFMEENKDNPFFVYYPMVLPHDPFVPTPDNPTFADFDAKSKVNDPAFFGEMVQYMDKLIGQIVAKTEELGVRENTLILFIGDNGTDRKVTSLYKGENLRGNKGYTTNAGTHVPFIANWKGHIKPKSINQNLVDFTDFLPCILEAAGGKNLNNTIDGLSFYPQLLDQDSKTRDWIFCHYNPNWGKYERKTYVQDKTWKLYENGEFYNLKKDPVEENPLTIKDQSEIIKIKIKNFEAVLNKYSD